MTHKLKIYPEIGNVFYVTVDFSEEPDWEEAAETFVEDYLNFVDHYDIESV